MITTLQMQLPVTCASMTPSTRDINTGERTLLKTAGAGTQSVVKVAISASGRFVVVKTLTRIKKNDRTAKEIARY